MLKFNGVGCFILGAATLLGVIPRLVAAPAYSPAPNGYTINGSSVTGSGTNPHSAYFLDATSASYSFNILPGSNLGNTTALGNGNELDFASGSVLNQGTLSATLSAISFQGNGVVTNTGTISGGDTGVLLGTGGSVQNSGTITGTSLAAIHDEHFWTSVPGAIHSVAVSNSGSLLSTQGDGIDDFNFTISATGGSQAGQAAQIDNSGIIDVSSVGIAVDDGTEFGGGSTLNTVVVANSGSITSNGFGAVEIDTPSSNSDVGSGTNLVSFNNSGTITGASFGVSVAVSNTAEGGYGQNNVTVVNSGTITATTAGNGLNLDELSNYNNLGAGINNATVVNRGNIHAAGNAIFAYLVNSGNHGDVVNTGTFTNSGTLTTAQGYGVEAELENHGNLGNATTIASAFNSGTITVSGTGNFDAQPLYLEPYNDSDLGNGVTIVTMGNTGTLTSTTDFAFVDYESGNYSEGGTATSIVTTSNSGTIFGQEGGVYLYDGNETNHGNGLSTISFVNSGTVMAPGTNANAVYIESYNDSSVAGNATTQVSFINTAGASISSAGTAVLMGSPNAGDAGTGLNSSALQFGNAGTITSANDYGADLSAGNTNNGGNVTTTLNLVNTGTIGGATGGLRAIVTNQNNSGTSTTLLTFVNTGTITDQTNRAVDLENSDSGNAGVSSGQIVFTNGASGNIFGTTTGVFISNTGGTADPAASVVNAGMISGGTTGIDLQTDYANVTALGGMISGGANSVLLAGGHSTVTVQGRSIMNGVIQGSGLAGNTLNLDLIGMTPAQIATARLTIAAAGGGPGTLIAGDDVYSFDGFQSVIFNGRSFAGSVDAGLSSLGADIDDHPLSNAYDAVYVQGSSNAEATLTSLSGRQFLDAFGQIGLSNATEISSLADDRAFQLRSGSSGFDISGLTVSPSSMIAGLSGTASYLNRLGASAMGGATMSDSRNESRVMPANSPKWGAWISGTVTFADQSGNPGANYHGTSGSPTVGIDYRLTDGLVVGALFNYTRSNVDFGDGSNLDTDTELAALYADWTDGHWFLNGLAGYGHSGYDQSRMTLGGSQASGSPDGDEVLATLGGGYDFKLAGWTLSPEAGFQYTHLTKDSFNETGAGAFDLNVGDQTIDSLRSRLGFHATRVFEAGCVKLIPQVNAAWYHEIMDDTNGVANSLPGAPALGSFIVTTSPEGRDFALVGAGVTAVPAKWHDNVSFFVNYDAQVGQENFIAHTVDGGVQVNF